MNRSRRTAALAVALTAVGAAGLPATASALPLQAKVTSGHSLVVKLRAPKAESTGYHWAVSTRAPKSLLRRTSNSFAGKRQVFTFRAGRPGATVLRFRYVPPGRGRKAIKRYELTVEVNRPARRLRCYPPRSHTVISNGKARIFWIRRSVTIAVSGPVERHTYKQYYGCAFSRERAHPLDNIGPNGPLGAARNRYGLIRMNGTTAAWRLDQPCPFIYQSGCPDGSSVLSSQDLRTGRVIRRVTIGNYPTNVVTGLVLSRRGGIAWIEFMGNDENLVYRSDRAPKAGRRTAYDSRLLDDGLHGYVDPDSLAAEGNGFRWKRDGVLQHARLR